MPKRISLALGVVLLILGAHHGSFAKDQVRMGYLQSDLHQLAAFVCLDKGFYRAEGVDVVVAGVFKAGPEEMSAFASRDLDFGYVGEAPAAVAVANRVADVKIIAQVNLEGSAVVVRKDSGLTRLKDLVGKTVAVPGYATVQDFLFRRALSKDGIELNAVNTIIIKPPEMIPVLTTKQIDAFVAWEPYPAKGVTSGAASVLAFSSDLWPKHPCCVVVVDARFMNKNPELVNGILRAHVKATRFILDHPEEAVQAGVKFTGMDTETVKLAMKNIKYECDPDVQGLLEFVTFLSERGHVKINDPGEFVRNIIDKKFFEDITRNR
ncbi:MAG: ABC transporter substrate-binding protein [Thermodesulfobacteriota bacterium]